VTRIYTDHGTLALTAEGLRVIDLVDGLDAAQLQELIGLPVSAAA
jgi:acyl CoA:acetate/3-ketoacid CoA transferase beta subunit